MRSSRLYWLLLLLALMVPSAARATGSLTIPNTIAAQPTGNVQASLLDANWTQIATYVNQREVASGTLGARPAAGTAGRWYFASDDNGGTLYFDFGGAWIQAGATVSSGATLSGSRGLNWATSSATNTSYNGTATQVTLRNPSTGSVVTRTATATITNNVLTAGPTADGRDQAAAFTISTWLHFYYIWNGSSLNSLSSACAPSDANGTCSSNGGPVLPAGYTHWTYIGPVRFATTGILNATWIQACVASIEPRIVRLTAAGTGAEQSYDDSDTIPPNHQGAELTLATNAWATQQEIRVAAGGRVALSSQGSGVAIAGSMTKYAPLTSQTVYFFGNAGGSASIIQTGYRVPNGGC